MIPGRLPPGVLRLAAILLTFSGFASATLGGNVRSIQEDLVRMRGTWHVKRQDEYAVHEIRLPSGTVVREYVSNTGKVFAVTWRGPFLPDLQQLLGEYFEQYKQAATAAHTRGRGPLLIREPALVVESGGHMRAFAGKAYLPGSLPEGLHPDAIR